MTPRQQAFVREYLKDGNSRQAAIRAGYAAESASVRACELLKRDDVAAEVERVRAKAEATAIADHEECCKILAQVARGAEKDADRIRAIEALARLRGYNPPEEQKLSGEVGVTYRFVVAGQQQGANDGATETASPQASQSAGQA